jgi:hypothetical protein
MGLFFSYKFKSQVLSGNCNLLVNRSVHHIPVLFNRFIVCATVALLSFPQMLQVGSEDAQMHALFADSFAALGRLDNITLVMVFHPQYLESFLKTQHYLLQMDGPLPLHYRHYIGIMVCKNPMKISFFFFFLI